MTYESQLGSIQARLNACILRLHIIEDEHNGILEDIAEAQELLSTIQADMVTVRAQMGGHT